MIFIYKLYDSSTGTGRYPILLVLYRRAPRFHRAEGDFRLTSQTPFCTNSLSKLPKEPDMFLCISSEKGGLSYHPVMKTKDMGRSHAYSADSWFDLQTPVWKANSFNLRSSGPTEYMLV